MDFDLHAMYVCCNYCKDDVCAVITWVSLLQWIGLLCVVVSLDDHHVYFQILHTKMLKACGQLSRKMACAYDCNLSGCNLYICWICHKWNNFSCGQLWRSFRRLPQSRRHYRELFLVTDVYFVFNYRAQNYDNCEAARSRNDGTCKRLPEAENIDGSAYEGVPAAADVDHLLPTRFYKFV